MLESVTNEYLESMSFDFGIVRAWRWQSVSPQTNQRVQGRSQSVILFWPPTPFTSHGGPRGLVGGLGGQGAGGRGHGLVTVESLSLANALGAVGLPLTRPAT
jgi:hypothetical protein